MNGIQIYSVIVATLIVVGQTLFMAFHLHDDGDVWLSGLALVFTVGYTLFLFKEIRGEKRTGVISTAISGIVITVLYAIAKLSI